MTTRRKRRPSRSRRAGPSRPSAKLAAARPSASGGRRSLLVPGVVLALIGGLGYLLFVRARGPGEIPAEALRAADAAGCGALERPVEPDPSRVHLAPGETFDYEDPPAAAGPHDASPLPPDPHVYASPVPETRAVHNLEHAYVLVYYRPSSEGGLSTGAIDALERLAREQDRVIMAPYPNLPDGEALALLAWNIRWMCPADVTPAQAVAIATGFVDAFRGTSVAPEAPRGLLGPFLQP